jgi:surfactin synthase thioesterase subunit
MKVRDKWLLVLRPVREPVLRLFCFPFAGGGAATFRDWSDHLPSDVEICAVQLPGREGRFTEGAYTRLNELVHDLAATVISHTDVPYVLFGHSMGALVAFGLARELRRRKQPGPQLLMVSGRRAPQRPDPDPPIHALPEQDLLREIRQLNGTPEAVLQNQELLELLIPTLRADFAVCETYDYTHEDPLECPIVAFGGTEDADAPREDVAAWSHQTSGSFSLRLFAGDHFYFLDKPAALLQHVAAHLERIAGLHRQRTSICRR